MNQLEIFKSEEFGEVRTVVINSEPWFVGKDVAEILGYSNARKALADHVDDEDKFQGDGVTIRDSIGREQTPTFINESGLYSLIISSKMPNAKKFKRWVTSEVLPSIRKTGSYTKPMSAMELMELQFQAIKEVKSDINSVNEDLQTFKLDMPLLALEIEKISNAVKKRGVNVLGGKESNSYNDKSLRTKVYSDIHREIRRQFGVNTFKAIKRSQVERVVGLVESYIVPFALANTIKDFNAQMSFE